MYVSSAQSSCLSHQLLFASLSVSLTIEKNARATEGVIGTSGSGATGLTDLMKELAGHTGDIDDEE